MGRTSKVGSEGWAKTLEACRSKQRFDSWVDANRAAARIGKGEKYNVVPYSCPVCHGWHLGGKPKTGGRPVRGKVVDYEEMEDEVG